MKKLSLGAKIGIIGGGQLGRMLAMASARLGFKTIILDPDNHCPAAQCANEHIIAAYDDECALAQLGDLCDVVTYEFENISLSAIARLAQKITVSPPPLALEIAQDRFLEKKYLNDCAIATPLWRVVDDIDTLLAAIAACGGKGILKTRRFGYDGKGQVRLNSENRQEAEAALAAIKHQPAILEGFVDFKCEISLIAARSHDGNIAFFDAPQNDHQDGILRSSSVPANVAHQTLKQAQDYVATLLHALNYVGVMAVEFFVLHDDTLLANEFAPRVHNSGHWTEAACIISQFEQHIRAVTGWPLGDPSRHSNCVMENLIGHDIERIEQLLNEPNIFIHLYGKSETRLGRKMGHFTRLV